jgi:hypothetical protein
MPSDFRNLKLRVDHHSLGLGLPTTVAGRRYRLRVIPQVHHHCRRRTAFGSCPRRMMLDLPCLRPDHQG